MNKRFMFKMILQTIQPLKINFAQNVKRTRFNETQQNLNH